MYLLVGDADVEVDEDVVELLVVELLVIVDLAVFINHMGSAYLGNKCTLKTRPYVAQ